MNAALASVKRRVAFYDCKGCGATLKPFPAIPQSPTGSISTFSKGRLRALLQSIFSTAPGSAGSTLPVTDAASGTAQTEEFQ
jgi:hypothetical protein